MGPAPAGCAKAPRDEEVHQAQPHLETQIREAGSHLLLMNHSWISTFPKTSEACARSFGTLYRVGILVHGSCEQEGCGDS